MERIIVNLEDAVGRKLKARADAEQRSYSNYVEQLVLKDLREAGLLPDANGDHAEFGADVAKAVKANPAIRPQIETILRKSEGKRRVGAASGLFGTERPTDQPRGKRRVAAAASR